MHAETRPHFRLSFKRVGNTKKSKVTFLRAQHSCCASNSGQSILLKKNPKQNKNRRTCYSADQAGVLSQDMPYDLIIWGGRCWFTSASLACMPLIMKIHGFQIHPSFLTRLDVPLLPPNRIDSDNNAYPKSLFGGESD